MTNLEQQHGQVWERYVRQECHELREAGLALVRKNWRAPRVPREGVHARIDTSKPDFSGVVDGGRAVVFECKATMSTTSLDLDRLADHQADHLRDAHELGAGAFVYVLDGDRNKWVVPWPALSDLDRGSYPIGEYPDHQKQEGETFLDTLERLEVLDG